MIYLGLGSNMGDRELNLRQAVNLLALHPSIQVVNRSAIYETPPFGFTEQAAFLNAVVEIQTVLSPHELLATCMKVEALLGRVREIHWGPRTIDIDILLFHDLSIDTEELTVPHPYMHVRPFVLVPLQDVSGDSPVYQGKTAGELLFGHDLSGITFYNTFNRE